MLETGGKHTHPVKPLPGGVTFEFCREGSELLCRSPQAGYKIRSEINVAAGVWESQRREREKRLGFT